MHLFNDPEKGEKEIHASGKLLSNRALQTGVFFRLLPYQILLIVISAVNSCLLSFLLRIRRNVRWPQASPALRSTLF